MQNVVELFKRLGRDEEGTAMIEYSILLGVIAVAAIATVITVGSWVTTKWTALCSALPGHGTC